MFKKVPRKRDILELRVHVKMSIGRDRKITSGGEKEKLAVERVEGENLKELMTFIILVKQESKSSAKSNSSGFDIGMMF